MNEFPPPPWPVVDLGLAAIVLGSVAAVLVLLPILSVPLSALGLLCGIVGTVIAASGYPASLRMAVSGTMICALVLGATLLINFAPRGKMPGRSVPRLWEPSPAHPSVPPPAQTF